MHACGYKDVTTCRHGTWDYNRGQQVPEGCPPHTLGWGAHHVGLLDWYRSPTKCKKVRSCDICSQGEMSKKEKLINCRHCTKSFHSCQYYLNHLAVEHAEASGVTARKHHCNTCGREYANLSALRNHKCRPKGEKWRTRLKSATVSSTTSDQTEPTE